MAASTLQKQDWNFETHLIDKNASKFKGKKGKPAYGFAPQKTNHNEVKCVLHKETEQLFAKKSPLAESSEAAESLYKEFCIFTEHSTHPHVPGDVAYEAVAEPGRIASSLYLPWLQPSMGSLAKKIVVLSLREQAEFIRFLKTAKCLAATYAYLHSKGITHCDIKPSNIMYDSTDNPFVIDFGEAHRRATLQSHSFTNRGAQTAFYAPPEDKWRSTSDVFSLGIVLLEWIYPWRGWMPEALYQHYRKLTVEPFIRVVDIIERMTNENKYERPRMEDIVDELLELPLLQGCCNCHTLYAKEEYVEEEPSKQEQENVDHVCQALQKLGLVASVITEEQLNQMQHALNTVRDKRAEQTTDSQMDISPPLHE